MKRGPRCFGKMLSTQLGIVLLSSCLRSENPVLITENNFDSLEIARFVEPDFPFITVQLDARKLGPAFPDSNHVARGLAVQLGDGAYGCFDMDLLRWSVAWSGEFISMVLPSQVSYQDFFKRNNNEQPVVLGKPTVATGLYPGWSSASPTFEDIRPRSQQVEGLSWGPIPEQAGRWDGAYVYGNRLVLSYRIGQTPITEIPGAMHVADQFVFTRTFRVGVSSEKLYLNVAEVRDGEMSRTEAAFGYIIQGASQDSVTAASVAGIDAKIVAVDNRYLVVEVLPADTEREFTVSVWKGAAGNSDTVTEQVANYQERIPEYENGGKGRWDEKVFTKGQLGPDTAAYVLDLFTLPLPNPWGRNVRVADVAFFDDGRAALSTYEGDVWIVDGIDNGLERLGWKRYASGLYEPMSIEVVDGEIFVYAKEGIVRLNDLNGDGEADYYENFSNLMNQSTGTREWAADMVADKAGNFYVAKGGHISGAKGLEAKLHYGGKKSNWRASSAHSGTIMKISGNGRKAEVIASGLRMPYIGLNRETGFLTASDQQGNFVPATPIYPVKEGDYFGVPLTLRRQDEPAIAKPITWLPHRVERSGISQTWINSETMGPLSNQMVHFSFGRPGIFRVLLDTLSDGIQGGVTLINANHPAPVMKGEIRPQDGFLYISGFNNYASNSKGISAFSRLRYTGKPSYMVSGIHSGKQGILLTFDSPLDRSSATDAANFSMKRWNYKRTARYGSGHYLPDGAIGEETVPVLASYLSQNGKYVYLVVQDNREVDQVEIEYMLNAQDGTKLNDEIWFTIHEARPLDLAQWGLGGININIDSLANAYQRVKQSEPGPTVELGEAIFKKLGCAGCHAIRPADNKGMYGPPIYGLAGRQRVFEDGSQAIADNFYLEQSILTPAAKIVKGYQGEMPSFLGIVSNTELNSIVLFINSLANH